MENESKIVERVVKLETKSEQHDREIKDLKDTTKAINRLATSVELIAQQLTTTNEKIEKLDKKVDDKFEKMDITIEEIKSQPDKKDAKKWREGAKYVGLTLLGAVVALVLKQIGLI